MITGAMHAPAVTPSAANKTTLRYPAASRIQIATKTAAYVQAQPVAIGRPLRVSKPGQLGRCAEKSRIDVYKRQGERNKEIELCKTIW